MRDRISQAEIVSFANAAVELWRQSAYPFVRMHDVVSWVWTGGNTDIKLPPAATQEYYRKIGAVRKQLIDEGHLVCPVVDDYARKVKVSVFAEEDAQRCLPRKGAPLAGFLFVGEDSSERDLMIWAEWLRAERKVSTARGSEAAESIANAQRKGLAARAEVRPLLALEAGASSEGAA
jgi:hypothetical protein